MLKIIRLRKDMLDFEIKEGDPVMKNAYKSEIENYLYCLLTMF